MGKYLKKFDTHAEYLAFTQTSDFIKPNVSHCIQENEVHYNPIETRVVAIFNVTDASSSILLYLLDYGHESGSDMFDKIEIDGTEVSIADIDVDEGLWSLSEGAHTVAYTLKDPTTIENGTFGACRSLTSITIPNSVTSIGDAVFFMCTSLTSITIPNNVTSIGSEVFYQCSSLTSINIPSGVTSIGESAFYNCSSLESITSLAATAPTITSSTFQNVKTNGTLYVPSGSIGYDVWMQELGSGWTKIEQ